ncbi:hypothetical protein CAEBREN_07919 [Caenorhabditis brenneri]|uniref:MULE transposase domain-containing protein n=1 Tax=Caenorhabditis brenneri TaxID=135651 RepID=G0P666_CAEBE|nr:hypothetical protein CAEBREN_07919 [Caenorhabditis brenneri]
MPRGVAKVVESIDGWPMKQKKECPGSNDDLYYCVHRDRDLGCHACYRVDRTTKNFRIIRSHSRHEKDEIETQTELARSDIREYAKDSSESAKSQINRIRRKYSAEAVMKAGEFHSLRKIISRSRGTDETKRDVDVNGIIAGEYELTMDGNKFLISDTKINGKRMLIFASQGGLELLAEGNVIFADGTFECVPDGFSQLFTVHTYISESVIRPVVFGLLPSKQTVAYESFLTELKKQPELANWSPQLIIADFEMGIRNAFTSEFPTIEAHACYFHLVKAWRSKATQLKIYEEMLSGKPLYEFWKTLKALPFMKAEEIPDFFELLCDTLPAGHSAKEFVAYLDKNYVNGTATSEPMFAPRLWSCKEVTSNEIHRTTNSLEVWHKTLSPVINMSNGLRGVRLSDLIEKLKEEDMHTVLDGRMLKVNSNYRVSASRKNKNITKDRKILKVLKNDPAPPDQPLTGVEWLKAISMVL